MAKLEIKRKKKTFCVKSSVYKRYGYFDTKFKIASDAELMMRFLEVKKIKVKYMESRCYTLVKQQSGKSGFLAKLLLASVFFNY